MTRKKATNNTLLGFPIVYKDNKDICPCSDGTIVFGPPLIESVKPKRRLRIRNILRFPIAWYNYYNIFRHASSRVHSIKMAMILSWFLPDRRKKGRQK